MRTDTKQIGRVLSVLSCVHLWLSLISLVGCHTKPKPAPLEPTPVVVPPANLPVNRPATRNARTGEQSLPKSLEPPPRRLVRKQGDKPQDPKAPVQLGTRFDIYDILMPAGAVSRNEQFWKLVDEDKIDPGTYDVLRRNGVRVGVAPVGDWPAMRDLLDESPSTTHVSSATGRELTNLEVSLKHDILSQSIFVFLPDHTMSGRTFDRCENLMAMSFQQIPRKPGQLRVSMQPIVRSIRKQLTFSALGNEQEFAFNYPEKTLDMSLRADVPLNYVLVVAPSEEANIAASIGRAFLMTDTPAEKQEHVLIMVPRMFQIEDDKTAGPINGMMGR